MPKTPANDNQTWLDWFLNQTRENDGAWSDLAPEDGPPDTEETVR